MEETQDPVRSVTLIGSAFIGGFLHCVARGHDPFESARFANSVARFKGTRGGGIDSLPTAKDLKM
jgi:sugar/nucleoside kinase (ribokinase family)